MGHINAKARLCATSLFTNNLKFKILKLTGIQTNHVIIDVHLILTCRTGFWCFGSNGKNSTVVKPNDSMTK